MTQTEKIIEEVTLIKPVPDWPGYYADWEGNVWSTAKPALGLNKIKGFLSTQGYYWMRLYKNDKLKHPFIHRMVCSAWHGVPNEKPFVRHLDGNKVNNRPSNLKWGTVQENIMDAVKHGTWKAAENGKKGAHKQRKGEG